MTFTLTAEIHRHLPDFNPPSVFHYAGDCIDPDDAYHALDTWLKTLGVTDYRVTYARFSEPRTAA